VMMTTIMMGYWMMAMSPGVRKIGPAMD